MLTRLTDMSVTAKMDTVEYTAKMVSTSSIKSCMLSWACFFAFGLNF